MFQWVRICLKFGKKGKWDLQIVANEVNIVEGSSDRYNKCVQGTEHLVQWRILAQSLAIRKYFKI